MGIDGWELEILEPIPVVARLVGDQHDGVGLGGRGHLEPVASVLEVAGDREGHFAGALELADVPVGIEHDGHDILAQLVGGTHVPGTDLRQVVAHGARIVNDDRNRTPGDGRDHLVHHRVAGERNPELVARLQAVEVNHRLAADDDRLVAVVTPAAAVVGVALRKLGATLGVHTRELALVHNRDRPPRHVVLGSDGRDYRIARLDDGLHLLALGLRAVTTMSLSVSLTHEGQGADDGEQGEDGQGDGARALARPLPPVTCIGEKTLEVSHFNSLTNRLSAGFYCRNSNKTPRSRPEKIPENTDIVKQASVVGHLRTKPKMAHVSILHHVRLSFDAKFPGIACAGLTVASNEICVADHLGTDKSFKICVNDAGLRRLCPARDCPCAGFFFAGGEEGNRFNNS